MILRELQLTRRAQHAKALHATQLADLDLERRSARFGRRQSRTDGSARHLDTRRHVRCTTYDGQRLAGAGIDLTDVQTVSIRVTGDFEHLGHDHAGKRRRDGIGFLDFEPGHRQGMRQRVRRQIRVDQGTQPRFRELHGSVRSQLSLHFRKPGGSGFARQPGLSASIT